MERGPAARRKTLKQQQVWARRFWLDQHRRLRDRALFDFAIDSKLRGCDVVKVRIRDVVSGGGVRDRAFLVPHKTKRPVQFELMDTARNTMKAWLERRGGTLGDYVFPSRNDHMGHMSTRQYARLVHEWVAGIGLQPQEYRTHSLRRTKASIIYKASTSTKRRATCGRFRSCLAMPRSRVRCVTSVSIWKTLSNSRSEPTSEQTHTRPFMAAWASPETRHSFRCYFSVRIGRRRTGG